MSKFIIFTCSVTLQKSASQLPSEFCNPPACNQNVKLFRGDFPLKNHCGKRDTSKSVHLSV